MKVGDLVRHTHYGYVGIIVGRNFASWSVLRSDIVSKWWPEHIEVINESR